MLDEKSRVCRNWSVWMVATGLLLSHSIGCDKSESLAPQEESRSPHSALWLSGTSANYTFRLTSATSLGGLPAAGEIEIIGKVKLFAAPSNGGRVALYFQPSEVELVRPTGAQADAVKQLTAELQRTFGVELTDGVLSAYLEPQESELLSFGLRRQLAVLVQRAEPKKPGAATWEGEEWDASGRAQIQYAMVPGSPGTFSWKKKSYSKVLANKGSHAALQEQSWLPEVVKSEGQIKVDEHGVVAIERDEVLRAELTPEQFLRSSYSATLKRLESAKSSKVPKPEDLVRRPVGAPPPQMDTSALDAIRFAGKTWDEVLASLPREKDGKSPGDFGARQAAFHAFVGLFRTDKQNIKKAQVLIEQHDPRSSTLLRALAAASTEASLGLLSRMSLEKDRPLTERRSVAATFLRAELPPSSAVTTLEAFADDPDLRETGLLGLGTFARLWSGAGAKDPAERAAKRLEAELARAKSADEKAHCLLAIANSGDERFFESAKALQSSTEPKIREAAIHAIRLMKDARVEPALVDLLQGTKKPAEVVTILSALAQQKQVNEETVALVEAQTKPDLDAAIRRQATVTLGAWSRKWPRIVKLLGTLAESDADARVREAAQLRSM